MDKKNITLDNKKYEIEFLEHATNTGFIYVDEPVFPRFFLEEMKLQGYEFVNLAYLQSSKKFLVMVKFK